MAIILDPPHHTAATRSKGTSVVDREDQTASIQRFREEEVEASALEHSKMADDAKAEKKEKKKPEGLVIPPKKPKLSKAERRALQEQQRAAKAAKQQQQGKGSKGEAPQQQQPQQQAAEGGKQKAKDAIAAKETESAAPPEKAVDSSKSKTISLFSHLPPYQGTYFLAEGARQSSILKPRSSFLSDFCQTQTVW